MKASYKLILFIVTASVLSATSQELKKVCAKTEMLVLDQRYIPVLYFTLKGDIEEAKRASFFLEDAWQNCYQNLQGLHRSDEDWQEGLRMTNAWLQDALLAVRRQQEQDSYMFLDHVRYQLMELRQQQGIVYFLDKLWDFEVSIDMAVDLATNQMICLIDDCELRDMVTEVNYSWFQVEQFSFDPASFEMDSSDLIYWRSQQNKLSNSIAVFNKEISEGDETSIHEAAVQLRRAYVDYLHCFGNFSGTQI